MPDELLPPISDWHTVTGWIFSVIDAHRVRLARHVPADAIGWGQPSDREPRRIPLLPRSLGSTQHPDSYRLMVTAPDCTEDPPITTLPNP